MLEKGSGYPLQVSKRAFEKLSIHIPNAEIGVPNLILLKIEHVFYRSKNLCPDGVWQLAERKIGVNAKLPLRPKEARCK